MIYKIVICPKCHTHQITRSRKNFKCRICGKTTTLANLYKQRKIIHQTTDYNKAKHIYTKITDPTKQY